MSEIQRAEGNNFQHKLICNAHAKVLVHAMQQHR